MQHRGLSRELQRCEHMAGAGRVPHLQGWGTGQTILQGLAIENSRRKSSKGEGTAQVTKSGSLALALQLVWM